MGLFLTLKITSQFVMLEEGLLLFCNMYPLAMAKGGESCDHKPRPLRYLNTDWSVDSLT